jgi:serine/threonine protein kinase
VARQQRNNTCVVGAEPSAFEFQGTHRFEVLRCIGAGGMGVVYEVRDRDSGSRLALKVLQRVESWALLRFKQEFRALADVNHPNLVGLHELVCEDGLWFVTMELVEGVDFLSWVRPGQVAYADTLVIPAQRPEAAGQVRTSTGLLDEGRLRSALHQLCVGVSALHGLGKLHRDLKPSNVLVTPEGRVVILDFGLITELAKSHRGEAGDKIVGTAAYMAPEQAAQGEITEASDWYAVGVMLYEALTGVLPFAGGIFEVLVAKQQREAGPPRELAPEIPADLEALCRELVQRERRARPRGSEILGRLRASERPPALPSLLPTAVPLVGREAEHALLDHAFASVLGGTPLSLVVQGRSGMGKSTLVRAFLERVEGRALVLSGRCYERESVPYKAVDSLIDALCNELLSWPEAARRELLPPDVGALARVFPVLSRIETVRGVPLIREASELRSRAFAALRELLRRLSERRPLVLCIDDLQWGDADSGALLRDLLAPPDPPALMLLCCHRAEDVEHSPLLDTLRAPGTGVEVHEIMLAPLPALEARKLARALLGNLEVASPAGVSSASDDRAERVAREAHGNPFLVVQLAQHVGAGSDLESGEVSFERLMSARLAELGEDARAVLELVALSGCPISREVVRDASGISALDEAMSPLRARQLIRSSGTRTSEAVECYHDRIREAVTALLPAERARSLHLELAHAFVQCGADDPETIARHFHAAGETERAGAWAEIAAERAAAALAFDHAAALYSRALAWRTRSDEERRALWAKLGDALASAGRGQEAAAAYRSAAQGAQRSLSLSRRQKAARQLLSAGYVEEALQELGDVFEALGMRPPRNRTRMLAEVVLLRGRIWLRGYGFRERAPGEVPEEQRLRVDATWSLASVLSTIDALRGAYFQAQHLLAALELGEPSRAAFALGAESAVIEAMSGPRVAGRSDEMLGRAHALAERSGDMRARAFVVLSEALRNCQGGMWKKALAGLAQAETMYREHCTDVAWDVDVARLFTGLCMTRVGQLEELGPYAARLMREAEERGNRYLAACVPGWMFASWLAGDRVDDLRRAEHDAMAAWAPPGFHLQHLCALLARVAADLYEGDGMRALATLEADWEAMRRSLLFKAAIPRTEGHDMRGRAALGAAACSSGPTREAALRIARDAADRLLGEPTDLARALGLTLSAGHLHLSEQRSEAVSAYRQAAELLDRLDMTGYAACARLALGDVLADAEGRQLGGAADALLRQRRVKKPRRFAAVYAPATLARH